MMLVPPGVSVHLVPGVTDLRRNIDALGVLIQEVLKCDPFSGHMFAFRGVRADMIKILWWDGTGLCLFMKRLEGDTFPWPKTAGEKTTVEITSAQLSMLIEGLNWERPERAWRPAVAG
ncbi:MAG: IS66 family insertion sequence element accessory protein TnpB [Rhodospirillaceae bacterium]|nr:IS66 family insertion sequence element accessory protein TnpB [Rhodospirillaceae bacterium]